jgi:hypothetical protein
MEKVRRKEGKKRGKIKKEKKEFVRTNGGKADNEEGMNVRKKKRRGKE